MCQNNDIDNNNNYNKSLKKNNNNDFHKKKKLWQFIPLYKDNSKVNSLKIKTPELTTIKFVFLGSQYPMQYTSFFS